MAEGRLAHAPISPEEHYVSAPGNGADVFIQEIPRPVKGLEPTPIDNRSKLPLPILPYKEATETSWHHHSHPSASPLLRKTGGQVVRSVRVQLTEGNGGIAGVNDAGYVKPEYGEHQRYHYFFKGPRLPETEQQQFEYAIWAATGYVPRFALDVSGNNPKVVKMNREQISRLHKGEIKVNSKDLLGDFIKDYLLNQDISHVDNKLVDEFVSTNDWSRKKFLGHWLLAQASEVATEHIDKPYREAHKMGLIIPGTSLKISNVAHGVLRKKRQQHQQALIQQLSYKLSVA